MNKIRVIDLLNKIAKGKEVPKKIKCGNIIYIYDDFEKDYVDEFEKDVLKREIRTTNDILDIYYLFRKTSSGRYENMSKHLNYEVEVIEDEIEIIKEDKPIEKISEIKKTLDVAFLNLEDALDKINRLENELEKENE